MKVSIYLTMGLVVVGILFGTALGFYLSPEYQVSMYDKNSMNLGPADRTFDLRYLNAMATHHREAMLLAEQLAKNTARPELQTLAANILSDEPKLIAELMAWKKDWYQDSKKVREPIAAKLGPADDKFDLRFLNAMIAHHEAGIVMTKETRLKSSRAEILNNADAVEAFLTSGIKALQELRSKWYNL